MADIDITNQLPYEFDLRPKGIGYTMRGWDFTREELGTAVLEHRMLNPAMELGTNVCPWNCSFCFTEDSHNPVGRKRRLENELTVAERLSVIEQAAALGARSINFVGAGEPTIDPDFWTLVEAMARLDITPIIYTEGALRLTDRAFVRRLFRLGATVVIKVNSLWNAAYQNAVVRGEGTKPNANSDHFTELRNEAIKILMEEGFADCEPTRLAFDTIVCKQNVKEIPSLHMHARDRNIFILLVNYLPSGRSSDGLQDALDRSEQALLFDELARIDADKYSLNHRAIFPYAGGVPCSIRGTGIFVKITGNVFDCPGEMIPLGTTRGESLAEIWERARPITRALNGGCAPRDAFWANESFRLKPHRVTQIQGLQRVRASAPRSLF